MKTTREEILYAAVKMFAKDGYEAVSMSMISGALGITKGALYRHFESKQDIFDSIMERMISLDAERANGDHVPVEVRQDHVDEIADMKLEEFCEYTKNQFLFWTEDDFASDVRKMLTLEQFRNPQLNKWYQDALCTGPVEYTKQMFEEMIKQGKLNSEAEKFGAGNLAIAFFSPMHLLIQMSDGGVASEDLLKSLDNAMEDFRERWNA